MLVLVLDTSSSAVTAGLESTSTSAGRGGVTVRAERVVHNARGHGEYLAPLIAECLAEAAAAPADLAAVVAGTGPGPFTGLRVGLVTAAMFAETLGLPAYGVCSLDALADLERHEPALLVATDARRKEVYWARYEYGVRSAGPAVDRPADVPCDGVTGAVGVGIELYPDVLGVPLLAGTVPDGRRSGPLRRGPRPDRGAVRAAHPAVPAPPRRRGAGRTKTGESVTAATIVAMTPAHIDELMVYEREMFDTEAWTASSYRSRTGRHAQPPLRRGRRSGQHAGRLGRRAGGRRERGHPHRRRHPVGPPSRDRTAARRRPRRTKPDAAARPRRSWRCAPTTTRLRRSTRRRAGSRSADAAATTPSAGWMRW